MTPIENPESVILPQTTTEKVIPSVSGHKIADETQT